MRLPGALLPSSQLRKIDFHRLAHQFEGLSCALARRPVSLAKSIPDNRRIAVDLFAAGTDRSQTLDHDFREQLLVIHAADHRRPALAIHTRDRLRIGKKLVELKEVADVGIARILPADTVWGG